jgi:hypothetical protein
MNIDIFKSSLRKDQPEPDISIYLQALWHDGKGKWDESHRLIQDIETNEAAWIHAYLHRKEGDIANADYWYRRAGKKRPDVSLQDEWEDIARAFL